MTDAPVDCRYNAIIGQSSGNPDMKPDEGETWLFGVAWEPEGAPGLALSLDCCRSSIRIALRTLAGASCSKPCRPMTTPLSSVHRKPQKIWPLGYLV